MTGFSLQNNVGCIEESLKYCLIHSKLVVPDLAILLHRPRVCKAIEQGLKRKLTLVSAPAGYGKTSALVDFAQYSSIPVCWHTADERDRDLGLFAAYLVGAIDEVFSGFGETTREALTSSAGELFRDPAAIVGQFVNDVFDLETPFVLVVDNYESIDGAFGIREFVHRLLDVLPANCHLMLGSRVLPDVPVTRLVAKRQLIGLTEQNLRFDPGEVRELLQLSQVEISESQAETMAANAEGWITGVLLLSDLLRDGARTVLLDEGRATVQTYGYLAMEVLSRHPPDIQRFLHVSSVLREMSSRLCRKIMDIEAPQALLAEVERRNLFITRFGRDAAATYRYHNLFRDFLQEQLRQRDPTRYTALHRRAAIWFEEEHAVEEAVYHYLAAEAYPQATVLMERVAMEWFTRGRVETLLRWAEALPEEVKSQAPWLSFWQSRVLTDRYDYKGARGALACAQAGFTDRGDTIRLAKVYNQKATVALFEGRYKDVITEAQTALEMLGQGEVAGRAQAQRLIGTAFVKLGCFSEGVAELREALALFRQVGSPYDVVNLLQDLTFAFASQGRFDEAAACLNEALPTARRLGSPAQLAGVLNSLGWVHHVRGEYRQALALYEEGLAAARRGGDLRGQANISEGMGSIYRDLGDYRRAESLYADAWEVARESRPGLAVLILAARADMYRWRGDHARALSLLKQARQLAGEGELRSEQEGLLPVVEGITRAEGGEIETGLQLLSKGVRFLAQQEVKHKLAKARFLLAKAHLLASDKRRAAGELRQAMSLAEEIGTKQFAVVEGQYAEEVIRLGVTEGIAGCDDIADSVQQMRAFGEALAPIGAGVEESAVTRLEIYALGEGRVARDGQPVPASRWRGAMAKELFFYILMHAPLERDAIGLVFWPDLPSEKMINNFHATLYHVRRAVGDDVIVVRESEYRLGEVDYWFDVEEFEGLVERARLLPPHDWQTEDLWRRAVELYQGDFLPEVDRLWCMPKREALRQMYLEALTGMGACHEVRGAFEEAIDWYRRALEVDPLREDLHRRVMQAYTRAGRRSAALAQYRRCRKMLREELGVEPSAETQGLYQRIAGESPD